MGDLVPAESRVPDGQRDRLLQAWLGNRTDGTRRNYMQDLKDAAGFWELQDPEAVIAFLCNAGQRETNYQLLRYRVDMERRELAPATVSRRLHALTSALGCANMLGWIDWRPTVEGPRVRNVKRTSGPPPERVAEALQVLERDERRAARRDLAMVRLMLDLGLRAGSVVTLRTRDVDQDARTVSVLLKGRRDVRETKRLPFKTWSALSVWFTIRGHHDGWVFESPTIPDKHISTRAVEDICKKRGLGHPHGLRHAAITAAIGVAEAKGLPLMDVLAFSDHTNVQMLQRYYDLRRDVASQLADGVADMHGGGYHAAGQDDSQTSDE